jgi:hypothetical protein
LRDIEDDVGGVNASFSDLDRERKTMMRPWANVKSSSVASSNRRQGCVETCNELLVEVFWKTKG